MILFRWVYALQPVLIILVRSLYKMLHIFVTIIFNMNLNMHLNIYILIYDLRWLYWLGVSTRHLDSSVG